MGRPVHQYTPVYTSSIFTYNVCVFTRSQCDICVWNGINKQTAARKRKKCYPLFRIYWSPTESRRVCVHSSYYNLERTQFSDQNVKLEKGSNKCVDALRNKPLYYTHSPRHFSPQIRYNIDVIINNRKSGYILI